MENFQMIPISAKEGTNLELLLETIREMVLPEVPIND